MIMTPYEEISSKLRELLVGRVEAETIQEVESAVALALADFDIIRKERALIVYEQTDVEILNRFFLAKAVQGCSRNTLELYKLNLTRGIKSINKHIGDITADDIRIYLAKKKIQKRSSAYLANIHRTFSSFFTWATAEEWVEKNPMLRVEKIKVKSNPEAALSDEQMEMVRYSCRTPRERALVEFLYSTGCRISEAIALNISDIDFDKNECQVHGKGDKYRLVYISLRAKFLLIEYIKSRTDDNPALFVSDYQNCYGFKDGKGAAVKLFEKYGTTRVRKDSAEQLFRRISKRVGFRVHPHLMRKTVATHVLSRGMPIDEVRVMLGHESISTTTIYAQTQQDAVKSSHEKFI